ncbi:MAG TPA: ribonuclease HI [Cytophagales bacterium]|nr:ribonuclease HI [Cytophagales bacterium]
MIVIYTDGACSGNPGPGGFGTILTFMGHEKEISAGFRLTTNNRMELLAVITGIEAVKDPKHEILIVSDSKYVVDAINQGWLKGWIAKNFNKVKNADLWMRYYRASRGKKIHFKWIKGHAGHHFNERCDVLATTAAAQPPSTLLIDQGYLDSKKEGTV